MSTWLCWSCQQLLITPRAAGMRISDADAEVNLRHNRGGARLVLRRVAGRQGVQEGVHLIGVHISGRGAGAAVPHHRPPRPGGGAAAVRRLPQRAASCGALHPASAVRFQEALLLSTWASNMT